MLDLLDNGDLVACWGVPRLMARCRCRWMLCIKMMVCRRDARVWIRVGRLLLFSLAGKVWEWREVVDKPCGGGSTQHLPSSRSSDSPKPARAWTALPTSTVVPGNDRLHLDGALSLLFSSSPLPASMEEATTEHIPIGTCGRSFHIRSLVRTRAFRS